MSSSGHDWSHVPPDSSYEPSSAQYRLPESVFGKETPTLKAGERDDAVPTPLGVGQTYSVQTFEEAQQYYDRNADLTVPPGQQFAENAGKRLSKDKPRSPIVSWPAQG